MIDKAAADNQKRAEEEAARARRGSRIVEKRCSRQANNLLPVSERSFDRSKTTEIVRRRELEDFFFFNPGNRSC